MEIFTKEAFVKQILSSLVILLPFPDTVISIQGQFVTEMLVKLVHRFLNRARYAMVMQRMHVVRERTVLRPFSNRVRAV